MNKQASITIACRRCEQQQAIQSAPQIIFDNQSGHLCLNENSALPGLGAGGLFAKLDGKPDLNELGIGYSPCLSGK